MNKTIVVFVSHRGTKTQRKISLVLRLSVTPCLCVRKKQPFSCYSVRKSVRYFSITVSPMKWCVPPLGGAFVSQQLSWMRESLTPGKVSWWNHVSFRFFGVLEKTGNPHKHPYCTYQVTYVILFVNSYITNTYHLLIQCKWLSNILNRSGISLEMTPWDSQHICRAKTWSRHSEAMVIF